ncbi:hypothetical protein ATO46_14925 [Aeromonas schubertii]|uniref:T3SS regulon translocated regulator ExsE family protein n=1 Tax=Aeromonas schubertii TaxID=652 RepID=UPI00067F2784|nr:T3SS regulon translocated regulator ExsE family protein [Aeromonas schubertii]KUE80854.1 hypothetical protein ATO46_14925 [Aeromonas schubertii]
MKIESRPLGALHATEVAPPTFAGRRVSLAPRDGAGDLRALLARFHGLSPAQESALQRLHNGEHTPLTMRRVALG